MMQHTGVTPPTPELDGRKSPGSESTMSSTFSFTSTMEHRTYREDNGRVFQAVSDDYALPADERETTRLDVQHHAFKAAQLNKNYIAPIDVYLRDKSTGDESEKKVLDIGCGSGIWLVEMAREFPEVSFLGVDLAPTWNDRVDVPDNVAFELCNVVEGISCPDETFDVVHCRALMGGVRDWTGLIKELIRVVKPGGLVVSVDGSTAWPIFDKSDDFNTALLPEQTIARAPGYCRFIEKTFEALAARGLQPDCGRSVIPKVMEYHKELSGFRRVDVVCPFWGWPKDPLLRKAGTIMVDDTKEIPETIRLLIMDACGISKADYDDMKKGWVDCIGKPGIYTAITIHHNWAFKKVDFGDALAGF